MSIEDLSSLSPLLGSLPGFLTAGVALMHSIRARAEAGKARDEASKVKAEADARVQTALADALDSMRADLEQARAMAHDALIRASRCEEDRGDCERRLAALRAEFEDLRRSWMSQESSK